MGIYSPQSEQEILENLLAQVNAVTQNSALKKKFKSGSGTGIEKAVIYKIEISIMQRLEQLQAMNEPPAAIRPGVPPRGEPERPLHHPHAVEEAIVVRPVLSTLQAPVSTVLEVEMQHILPRSHANPLMPSFSASPFRNHHTDPIGLALPAGQTIAWTDTIYAELLLEIDSLNGYGAQARETQRSDPMPASKFLLAISYRLLQQKHPLYSLEQSCEERVFIKGLCCCV